MIDGLLFTAGILISFITLAIIVILLKLTGQDVGWGFQFQNPAFVIIMIIFLFIFSLSFFDLIKVNTPFASKINKIDTKI